MTCKIYSDMDQCLTTSLGKGKQYFCPNNGEKVQVLSLIRYSVLFFLQFLLSVYTLILHSNSRLCYVISLSRQDPVMLLHATRWFGDSQGCWRLCEHVLQSNVFTEGLCVSDAENLSVCLVSEGEILCLLNPPDKTEVKMSVTQTFIGCVYLKLPHLQFHVW